MSAHIVLPTKKNMQVVRRACLQKPIAELSDEELCISRIGLREEIAEQDRIRRLIREGKLPFDALPEGARGLPPGVSLREYLDDRGTYGRGGVK